ncbi:MAG: FAD-binding oxidoreductase [Thermoleophilaceae bacterium]
MAEAPAATAGDSELLTGWGRTAPTRAQVHRPRGRDQVRRLLAEPGGRGVIARGLGRSYGDAAQNAGGQVLDLTQLASLREFDVGRGRVEVDAGLSLDALIRHALPAGWFIPVSPGTRQVTVGGAIAADIHGKNHHRDGGFCEHVESFELLTATGQTMTVTPGDSPALFGATAGGMGMTGMILAATLRLTPVETALMRVDTERAADLDDVMARMEAGDDGYRYSVAWIDCLARGGRLGRSVLTRGEHAARDELPADAAANGAAPALAEGPALTAPPWAPAALLSLTTIRLFNDLWFHRAPAEERGRLQGISSFFHPLDGIRGWNRLYGARGLLQYQFVVPFGEEEVVREVLERVSSAGRASFLAVIKRFGGGRGGLSFPIPGWTLALDLPAGDGELVALLDGLDGLVAGAGGRVYLAKDSRLRPELLEAMYPDLPAWREECARVDPEGRLRSDLSRRLGLRAP